MIDLHVHPVTGPPGAGKTTALIHLEQQHPWLARFAVREYGLFLANAGHPLGLKMRDTLLYGYLLPNDLVQQEFAHFLGQLPDGVRSVAVEGYPRDTQQCRDLTEVLDGAGATLGELIVVDVPDEVAMKRVANRRICTRCGLPTPTNAKLCGACGGQTATRHDDSGERVAQRLREFRTISAEIRSYFQRRRLLRVVDGLQSPDEIRRRLAELLAPDSAGAATGEGRKTGR